ncbi:hypothetical protein BGW38_000998 [Lunasporangiospora selenospora]|uniref:DDE Tnp4 domain-containing protein n=1 Tax=Lunasporangiospora selenospora TaxID=979761 RepID=A0A9P6G2Q2_9FUNG|nr:hypothetical protein BGW38_000998 [Lunasporangiospora selenospora]
MPISERKRALALLDQRQRLEDEYAATKNECIQAELDTLNLSLLKYFNAETVSALLESYPTTKDMKAVAEKQRYFAPRYVAVRRTGHAYDSIRQRGSDAEFLEFMRISRSVFDSIVSSVLSQQHVFHNKSNNGQVPVDKQVAVTLWRMGHQGIEAGVGNVGTLFGLSEGTVMKSTQRCLAALAEISTDVIYWPSHGEKMTIKDRIRNLAIRGANAGSFALSSPGYPHQLNIPHRNYCNNTNTNSTKPSKAIQQPSDMTDAVGILSVMKVILFSRPTVSNCDDYLIPLPDLPPIPPSLPTPLPPTPAVPTIDDGIGDSDSTLSAIVEPASVTKKRRRVSKIGAETLTGKDAGEGYTPTLSSQEPRPRTGNIPRKGKGLSTKAQQAPLDTHFDVLTTAEEPIVQAGSQSQTTDSIPRSGKWVNRHKGLYLKRNYGFNVLLVSDSITRIRFADATRGGSMTDLEVYEESKLFKESEKYFANGESVIAAAGCAIGAGDNVISSFDGTNGADQTDAGQSNVSTNCESTEKTNGDDTVQGQSPQTPSSSPPLAEILEPINTRAMDCQKMLLARFPSLLELRLQLKDEASQEFARAWVMACIFIHNLVLGDDMCYDPIWEPQLEKIKDQLLKAQYEQQYVMQKLSERKKRKYHTESHGKARLGEEGNSEELHLSENTGDVHMEDLSGSVQADGLLDSQDQESQSQPQGMDLHGWSYTTGSLEPPPIEQLYTPLDPGSLGTLERDDVTLSMNKSMQPTAGSSGAQIFECTYDSAPLSARADEESAGLGERDLEYICVISKENCPHSWQSMTPFQPLTVGDSSTPPQRPSDGDQRVTDEYTTNSNVFAATSTSSSGSQPTPHPPSDASSSRAHSLDLLLN